MTSERAGWAPVALFIYNRADHVRSTITSMQTCPGFTESPVYVFADGPRTEQDAPMVAEARAAAHHLLGNRAVFVELETNQGLAASITNGVTELCDRYGKVIVVEDDLVVSPYFLTFLNDALRRYADDERVMQVSGHMYDVPSLRHDDEAIFLTMMSSWGWGTWKRAWDLFDPEAHGWQELLRDLRVQKKFDLDGHIRYSKQLARQMQRTRDSWAVRWYYTVFTRNGLVLFPPQTLVLNSGLDGSGVHHRLGLPVRQAPLGMSTRIRLPGDVAESTHKEEVYDAIQTFVPRGTWQKIKVLPRALLRAESRSRTLKAAITHGRIQSAACIRQLIGNGRN